jgi:SAM-dependent methyltransferase
MNEQALTPATTPISWSGTFPQNYEDNLKFIFGPYADDLANRVDLPSGNILELACGTGQVTQRLAAKLNRDVNIWATDLSPDMMAVAQQKVNAQNISWAQVDMCAIPYSEAYFDVVVCQFGLMFAPDKLKALQEIYRVLNKGGRLIFNTWGLLANNKVFQIFNETLVNLMNFDLAGAEQGPFSLQDEQAVRRLLSSAGFSDVRLASVSKTGESPTAAQAAKGFFQGSQLAASLKEKNPALGDQIQAMAANEFMRQLADHPMRTPLQAWVFEAGK